MRTIALIADVHANALALEAVFRDGAERGVGAIWCAGDVVGYNAMARETIALLQRRRVACVHGNHDLMVLGRLEAVDVGPRARRALKWTRDALGKDDIAWLTALPAALRFGEDIICVHATVRSANQRTESDDAVRAHAAEIRALFPAVRICICGHTHKAGATYVALDGRVRTDLGPRVSLDGEGIWFINPGSVGEPRDGDPRASYAILEWPPRGVRFRRVRYDRARLAKLNAVRLPTFDDPKRNRLTQWLDSVAARITEIRS